MKFNLEGQDWDPSFLQSELSRFLSSGDSHANNQRLTDTLRQPISRFSVPELAMLTPGMSLADAMTTLQQFERTVGLVQQSRGRIEGIIERAEIEQALQTSEGASSMKVSHLMERNISIEPDVASVREVIVRVTAGACRCIVVVDSGGAPHSIITPRRLFALLNSVEDGTHSSRQAAWR